MNFSIWPKRIYFGPILIFYLIILFLYGSMQQSKLPAAPIVAMQVAAAFITFFFSFLYSKKSIAITCIIIFIFQLICCFGLRYFNNEFFHNPLGYNPADALAYHLHASQFYRYSLHEMNNFMDSMDFMLDDQGMNYITYFIYKIAGSPERGQNLAVLINICCITLSSYYAYLLSRVFVANRYAHFTAFVWGTQLYATYTAASGLKENYMVCLIIISLFYIVKLCNDFSLKNILLALLYASSALFFRMALFYMLICSILFVAVMKFPLIRRYLYLLLIIAVILTWISYKRTFDEMVVLRSGADAMDYDTYEGLVQGRMDSAGIFATVVSYLSALIGPLPNIIASGPKANYITLYGFSSFCKSFYAFYFIYAIIVAIKERKTEALALLVFWFLEISMLIITFFTLHDRYHWPHVLIVITLSVWGAIKWDNSHNNKLFKYLYIVLALIIIIIFNFR